MQSYPWWVTLYDNEQLVRKNWKNKFVHQKSLVKRWIKLKCRPFFKCSHNDKAYSQLFISISAYTGVYP